uniref:Xylulose kinase-1 n=1 Tax=Tanacetum cinerariifolium TaxID=118510 RepID=A0A699J7B1_TANCI|nr:hypothetical protein [Tanacetum cinerariifolium]
MANLTFADMYNMVAFLSKSDASADFDQIVDFINAQVIQYALMVNPTIYVSCIKQFWATVSIKKANDVVKLRALIDGKRVEVFTKLARMGYEKPPLKLTFYKDFFSTQWKFLIHTLVQCISAKRTAWNEFSCSMASAVICLATGRKFNFFKYIFDSMVRNVDSPSKFLIVGKGFSDVETPLFAKMIVQPQPQAAEEENDVEIKAIDANEDITLVDVETQVDMDAEFLRRKNNDSAAKEVSAAEPVVFDDEEVTMTMAQTLIKMKAKKARLLDEHMAKKKYRSLKRKPISVAQAGKKHNNLLKEHGWDVKEPTKKRVAEETLLQDSFKKLKAVEVSGSHSTQDTLTNDPKEMSEEDVKNMLEIIPVYEFKVEALQVKYPLIDWEIHSEGSKSYWKIIRVGGITEAYQSFEDMLKGFDREDLDALWRLVKEKFSTAVPTVDKEKALWRPSDEDFHGGQQTKEQKFRYILQVIKKLELKKLDGLLGKIDTAAEELKKLL